MENKEDMLKMCVVFKSGRKMNLEATKHHKGQLREWVIENLTLNGEGFKVLDWHILDNGLINVNEIEHINIIN